MSREIARTGKLIANDPDAFSLLMLIIINSYGCCWYHGASTTEPTSSAGLARYALGEIENGEGASRGERKEGARERTSTSKERKGHTRVEYREAGKRERERE